MPLRVQAEMADESNDTESFTCSVCLEDYAGAPRDLKGDILCTDCLAPSVRVKFELALERVRPGDYPPQWGPGIANRLNINDYRDILDADFVIRYRNIQREYEAKGLKVYCKHMLLKSTAPLRASLMRGLNNNHYDFKCVLTVTLMCARLSAKEIEYAGDEVATTECKHFVGIKTTSIGNAAKCYHCAGKVCLTCELAVRKERHDCLPGNGPDREEALKGLAQGRDFQSCPREGRLEVIALDDGCNHVTWLCGTQVCFICGEECHHDSDHWQEGKPCSRWNQPNTGNAHHDLEPPLDLQLVEMVVQRGNERLEAGGVIDEAFFEDIGEGQGLLGGTIHIPLKDELINDDGNPDDVHQRRWRSYQDVHQLLLDGDHFTAIHLQILRTLVRADAGEDGELQWELLQATRQMIGMCSYLDSMAAGDPFDDAQKSSVVETFVEATNLLHRSILHKGGIATPFLDFTVMPLYQELGEEFDGRIPPEWLAHGAHWRSSLLIGESALDFGWEKDEKNDWLAIERELDAQRAAERERIAQGGERDDDV
ncbi:uncharacterized protein LTR77_002461 [Saxophila tyrrhenica]|uniref:RING-type domain-containing protein n=1 Tax=Saxophila tyrrhenica TaxID=1690608 RepID=A0AAV9PJ83_9PEZI|nr:hypothetical protein LTR77_002461 [Saxophila tyrrhenica]